MITMAIYNSSLKAKKEALIQNFLPNYFKGSSAPAPVKEYTLDQQLADKAAFKAKLRSVRPDWVKEKSTNAPA